MIETVLVTGASAGLGRELARLAASEGHALVLAARRLDRLEALAVELRAAHGVAVACRRTDLVEPGEPAALAMWLVAEGIVVDVLVNNAGFGTFGRFAEADADRERDLLRVNVEAVVALTRLLLPGMVERGRGRILNVASMAAFTPGPYMATYFASKAFVLSFSEALASETRGTGVTVTALCPGPVATEFRDVVGVRSGGFPPGLPVAHVVRAGWRGLRRGRTLVVPGLVNRLITLLLRVVPRAAVRSFLLRGQRRIERRRRSTTARSS